MTHLSFKIGTRLGIAFSALFIFMAVIITVGLVQLADVNSATISMKEAANKERLAEAWQAESKTSAALAEAKLRSTDPNDEEDLNKKINAGNLKITKMIDDLATWLKSDEEKQLLARSIQKRNEFLHAQNEAFKTLRAETMYPSLQAYILLVDDLVQYEQNKLSRESSAVDSTVHYGRLTLIAVGLTALIVGACLAIVLARSIVSPIRQAVAVAKAVASGDLSHHIEVVSNDEVGELMFSLKTMNASLHEIVAKVRSGTETIAAGSGEIASGNQDLSSRTASQAGFLEETATSMVELTAMVKDNAANAKRASDVAALASRAAQKGGTVVSEVIDTMGSISESSNKVVDIINIIDGIAFQTNILALNAAVEAARAGEHGRGFAVVSSEVRALAQRSATAAKEIKTLISNSVNRISAGTALVTEAGDTMHEVVDSINRVNIILTEMLSGMNEQARGITHINDAISHIDEVTQQNASLVEEAATAAHAMRDQAHSLSELVGVFRLDELGGEILLEYEEKASENKQVVKPLAIAGNYRSNVPLRLQPAIVKQAA